jgi:hypothetical protein
MPAMTVTVVTPRGLSSSAMVAVKCARAALDALYIPVRHPHQHRAH